MFLALKGERTKTWFRIPLVVGLFFLGLVFSRNLNSQLSYSPNTFTQSDISCSDVVSLFRWAALHHGFGTPNLKFSRLSERVSKSFAAKSDPQKLLFLSTEVDTLNLKSQAAWEAVIEKGDCSLYQNWFQENKQKGRVRFEKAVKQWLSNHTLEQKVFSHSPSQNLSSFSLNEEQLLQRQENFLNKVVSESHQKVLQTYKNREKIFFREQFKEHISDPESLPNSLLAKAALAALDPYSTYFSRSEFSEFYDDLSGTHSGIGLEVQKTLRGLGITEVVSNSPAEKAGLKVGDEIISISGHLLADLSFKTSANLLRGENATKVALTVAREGSEPREVSVLRTLDVFREQKVTSKVLVSKEKKHLAFVTLPSFYGRGGLGEQENLAQSSSEDIQDHLKQILGGSQKVDAVVLDLRGNPGGYLEEAVAIAGLFLGPKTIVGIQDNQEVRVLKSETTSEPLYSGPLFVVIDEETASAGEVLAAALKDHQRAIVMGAPASFGKGSVQKLFQLDDPFIDLSLREKTGALKLTTSVFFSPLGHSPANGGVTSHLTLSTGSPSRENPCLHPGVRIADKKPLLSFEELEKIKADEDQLKMQIAKVETIKTKGSISTSQILDVGDQVLGSEEGEAGVN